MKNKSIMLLAFMALIHTLPISAKKEKAKAQKIVKTEYGDLSIGILVPDRGMADPHVWIENGRLYAFCGKDKSWDRVNTWIMDSWVLWSSDDLINWRHEYTIKPTDTYIGDQANCWAGDLCERDGKYYWFFSNRNLSTGVMVADKITGPYKDLLGKPLLTPETAKTKPYDPEIFIDDQGEYHICFGAGVYYMARLAHDMKSLKEEPRLIKVVDKNGKFVGTGDKPTLYKNDKNGWHYLMWGSKYAMSKDLYGPYTYQGSVGHGAHCSVFDWNGVTYKIHETSDTNNFYRGVGLFPLYYNEDGTLKAPKQTAIHPGNGRDYTFEASQMGWLAAEGTTCNYNKRKQLIEGKISQKDAAIESAIFLMSDVKRLNSIQLDLRNQTSSNKMRIGIMSYENVKKGFFWNVYPVDTDWSKASFVEVDIKAKTKEIQHIEIPMNQFKGTKDKLMQIRIEPAIHATKGSWQIDNLTVR